MRCNVKIIIRPFNFFVSLLTFSSLALFYPNIKVFNIYVCISVYIHIYNIYVCIYIVYMYVYILVSFHLLLFLLCIGDSHTFWCISSCSVISLLLNVFCCVKSLYN